MKAKVHPPKDSPLPLAPTLTYYETNDLFVTSATPETLANLLRQIQWALHEHALDVDLRLQNIPNRLTNPDGDVVFVRIAVGKREYCAARLKGTAKALTTLPHAVRCPSWL